MLSNRLNNFDSSALRDAFKKQAELVNPVDLSIGYPEEYTPKHISKAGIKAINDNHTNYTPPNGTFELRQSLAKKLQTENSLYCNPETVTVVPGLTTGQLLIYLAILNPEDEVIVFDPYYPPYKELAQMLGARVINVATLPTFQPDIEAIKANITHKTKVMVINTPNNPSGAIYSQDTLTELADIAEKHNILIISDEIYEHFAYDRQHFSIGSIYGNTVTLNGFSKAYAMSGWRIGYMTGPLEIIEAINELQQYIVFSSSSIAQQAALQAIKHPPKISGIYRKKRDLVYDSLTSKGVEVRGLEGAYYAFFQIPHDMTDLEFIDKASNENLILLPGRAFSETHGYVRLSYGANIQTLKQGLHILEKLLD